MGNVAIILKNKEVYDIEVGGEIVWKVLLAELKVGPGWYWSVGRSDSGRAVDGVGACYTAAYQNVEEAVGNFWGTVSEEG